MVRRIFIILSPLILLIHCGPDVLYEDVVTIEEDEYAICQFSVYEGTTVHIDIAAIDDKKIDCFLTPDEGINQFKDFFVIDTLIDKVVTIDSNHHYLSMQNAEYDRIHVFKVDADHSLDIFVLDRDNYNNYMSGQPFSGYGFIDTSSLYFEIYFPSATEVYYVLDNTDIETPACDSIEANLFIGQRRSSSFLYFEGTSGIKVSSKSYNFTAPKSIPYYLLLVNWGYYENGGPVEVEVRVTKE